MQIYAISVLLFVSVTLGYSNVDQTETTTMNNLDNSVYSGSETPLPVPHYPDHMPTTGCFSNVPTAQEVDAIRTNNIETVPHLPQPQQALLDPVPPQFTPFMPPRSFGRPVNPGFAPGGYGYRPGMPAGPPMPFTPFQRFVLPNQQNHMRPLVIVKLLQPIILPVAKPMFPEGGDRNPDVDDVDSEKFTNGGFSRGHGFQRFTSNRRFGAEKYRNFDRPMPYRQNTFGPYKVGRGDENIHVTIKLH